MALGVLAHEFTVDDLQSMAEFHEANWRKRKLSPEAEAKARKLRDSLNIAQEPYAESAAKIKGRLSRRKLGAYDEARIAPLRRLKDDLKDEVGRQDKSAYYLKRPGKYAEVEDFDVERLKADLAKRHPTVPKAELEWFVPYVVFCYHVL